MFHEALSSGRTLVRYDRPGCGLSGPYDGPRTMELELATIRAVTEAIGAARFDLFGWSLGAAVAAQWAAEPAGDGRDGWSSTAAGRPARRSATTTAGGTCSGCSATHWGLGSDLLTDLFAPDADAGTRRALAQYQRAASSAETAVALLGLAYDLDVVAVAAAGHGPDPGAAPTRGPGRARSRRAGLLAERDPGRRAGGARGPVAPAGARATRMRSSTQVRRFLGLPRLRRAVPTGLTPRQTEVAGARGRGPHATASWPSGSASPSGRPSRTWSGSGCASASGRAPRWPPGTSRREPAK